MNCTFSSETGKMYAEKGHVRSVSLQEARNKYAKIHWFIQRTEGYILLACVKEYCLVTHGKVR